MSEASKIREGRIARLFEAEKRARVAEEQVDRLLRRLRALDRIIEASLLCQWGCGQRGAHRCRKGPF